MPPFEPEALRAELPPFAAQPATPQGFADYLTHYALDVPPGVEHRIGHLEVRGETVAVHFISPREPTGSLIAVHGLFDHAALWRHQVRWALSRDLCVCLLDLPGHGLSAGGRAHVESFEHYVDALEAAFVVVRPRLVAPILGIGQSTGCSVLMQAVLDASRTEVVLDDLILLAPLVRPMGDRIGRPLLPIVMPLVRPFVTSLPRGFYGNTTDPEFNRFMAEQDVLQPRRLPLSWVRAMTHWSAAFDALPRSPLSPCIIQGTRDRVVDWQRNLRRIAALFESPRIVMLEGARHNLMNEAESYRARIDAVLDERLAALR